MMRRLLPALLASFTCLHSFAFAQPEEPAPADIPSNAVPVFVAGSGTAAFAYANFHLKLEHAGTATLALGHDHRIELQPGINEIAYEQLNGDQATLRTWHNGNSAGPATPIAGALAPAGVVSDGDTLYQAAEPDAPWSGDFTLVARFKTKQGGTLASRAGVGKWEPDAKALFLRRGRLVYDIGWLGAMESRGRFNDDQWHTAVLTVSGKTARLVVDGKTEASKRNFTRPDAAGHLFQVGRAGSDFGGDYQGEIERVRFFTKAATQKQALALSQDPSKDFTKAVVDWPAQKKEAKDEGRPKAPPPLAKNFGRVPGTATELTLTPGANFELTKAWIQPLATVDHASFLSKLDDEVYAKGAFERGAKIYQSLCVTCHGTRELPGSLPTAPRFHLGPFKGGTDPYALFQTLQNGRGLMVPQPQYTAAEKYDVIHYIREQFLRDNETLYTNSDPNTIPRGMVTYKEEVNVSPAGGKPYERMNFGPALMWTYQVAAGNIADKAIAIRLDPGPGGVSKGRAWMVYDHDTMRVAAAYTGHRFVDWRGIAFDGSHGTHTAIKGETLFVNPDEPGWANPETGDWEDLRFVGPDDKPYGPLPRSWTQYKGKYTHSSGGKHRVVLKYSVGDAEILETPALIEYGQTPIFTRTMKIEPHKDTLRVRLAPAESIKIYADGPAKLAEENGFTVATIPPTTDSAVVTFYFSNADEASVKALVGAAEQDFDAWTAGGDKRWPDVLTTEGELGAVSQGENPAYVGDAMPLPHDNPWNAWMRLGGFDFFPGGKRAAVCTWNGDVWLVDGVDGDLETLTWKRIATGLFQPLGVKILDGDKIYITCRDQIARLHDLNGDEEIDYVEAFNSDHQVTEHFHEFAMGLQADDEGNLYYAKSACHAKPARVEHHGTLLKVSADGSETEILASGFRAANGVCLNPDGSFFVTDQEGHWTPKNRINWVTKGGFYGNMMGYTDVEDRSDAGMNQPMVWITNAKDRSPAELLWVDSDKWGPLKGSLINLSYGYGQAFIVPHENVNGQFQGGVCELPLPRFPTGTMRGRFHPENGQLYTCGMFAWAGSQQEPGGFYRVRYTGKPLHAPTVLRATSKGIDLGFSGPIAKPSPEDFDIKIWDLKRGPNYGSRHYNENNITVAQTVLSADRKTVFLNLPDMTTTWCMEIRYDLKTDEGAIVKGVVHNTIHHLSP